MKRIEWLLVASLCVAVPVADGKPREADGQRHVTQYEPPPAAPAFLVSGLSSGVAFGDTVCYGGTLVDGQPDPIPGAVPALRPYKAGRSGGAGGGVWTFDSGIGSNFTEPTRSPKAAGYHHRMEGWTGWDNTHDLDTWFRRSALCVLNGSHSMYVGLSAAEAGALCYTSGQGYGNNWSQTLAKTFTYPGTGSVTLNYRYQVDCEPNFDYLYVSIDTTGTGARPDVILANYTGALPAAVGAHTLTRGTTLRSTPGPVRIKFIASSDNGYSDEDGGYPTTCGHSSVDDVTLAGAITDLADFESGDNGWAIQLPVAGVGGDWSNIRALSTLPPALTFCPCTLSDSVLVFADLAGAHTTPADVYACSPWIDLKAGGDVGRPGKMIRFSGYFQMPLTDWVFVQTAASWYPAICPATGLPYVHPPTSDGFVRFFGGVPNCAGPGSPISIDFSAVIPPSAEQVKIYVGVLSEANMFANCTGVSNSTPWIDNVSLCVFGTPGAPFISLRTIDVFQDNFAADGTLNPASSGRVDVNSVKGVNNPQPGSVLGDTLVVNGDGGNQEVRVVFRVRPGPFTNAANLNAWATARWTAEPGLGVGWYSARCDTAEQGGQLAAAKWMSTLHELDPKFGGGTDRDRGAEGDFNQLSHDIFPDRILTPGSRIDYFVKARFLPPDPRNPGGTAWGVTPDTSGGRYLEMELLPSSLAADTTWNCVLYVDHHSDRDFEGQRIEELGLTAALGSGGNNREGTRFDRYDVQAPASQQASLGRPLRTQYGATVNQLFGYRAIAWHSGELASFNLVDEDANELSAWLTLAPGGHRFWGSGDGLARSMSTEGEPTTVSFLNTVCGTRFTCDTIRLATCPSGSTLDSTYCLPLANAAGAWFASALPVNARGNGCPQVRSFDIVAANPAVPSAKGQLAYGKSGPVQVASVANLKSTPVDYRTVLDGVSVGFLRDPNGGTHNAALCNVQTPALARAMDVLGWFQSGGAYGLCRVPGGLSDTEGGGGTPPPPAWRTRLGGITPNPMNPTTRISFTVGRSDEPTRLLVYDVTGRRVRTLVDAKLPEGLHYVTWDGRDEEGRGVGSGMYFVRLSARGVADSKKVVVAK